MRIIGLAGWSGSGKTTLLTKVIPRLVARGVTVSTVKHAHEDFDIDRPGKDSYRHREAGATEVLVSSRVRYAVMHELKGAPELTLRQILDKLSPADLVVIEGYKRDAHPKLEVYRAANGKTLLYPDDPSIVAVASDVALPTATIPTVGLDDADAVADIVLKHAIARDALLSRLGACNGAAHR